MTSPLVWFRLYRGKVWHLRSASAMSALCETPDLPSDRADACERVYGPVPENARLCEACGAASDVIADAIRLARQGDPRRLLPGVVGHLAPTPSASVPDADDRQPVDLAAALKASVEAAYQRRIEAMGDAS